ncbi:DUF3558 domain-containing protein [Amycolatopsis rubida]|uniref:DUF3558 domain-containing protein n=1 Tax=Amycolatopsis rubida TaxID=112413 RepID=A0ABX0BLD1_9PSEU|nr:DUF3558 domain-containing protein [Amycolatopsis rubida]MYW91220.1 DUF3558 domain-containing protein [Amycolatopsis rubida]NEC56205.1 DUF3558 domain-containing protein [Amycolatopsis rubida]
MHLPPPGTERAAAASRFPSTAAVLVLACVVVAGCSGADQAASRPDHAARSTPAEDVPGPGVPKVANPLDVSRFRQNPCDALASGQVSDLLGGNVRAEPDPHGPGGPACGWFSQAQVVIVFPTVDKLGLTSIYRAKGGVYPFFLPLDPVAGYPVVAYGTDDPRARFGECTVALGTSDRETVDVSITQSPAHKGDKDPCQSARDVAAQVLDNLRRG